MMFHFSDHTMIVVVSSNLKKIIFETKKKTNIKSEIKSEEVSFF